MYYFEFFLFFNVSASLTGTFFSFFGRKKLFWKCTTGTGEKSETFNGVPNYPRVKQLTFLGFRCYFNGRAGLTNTV